MVLAAGEHQIPRVHTRCPCRGGHRVDVRAQCVGVQIHHHARGSGDVSEVGEQAIGDVGHRLRCGVGGDAALPVGRMGNPVPAPQIVEPGDPVAAQRESGGRAAEFPDDGDHRTRASSAAQHRRTSAEIAEGGHRHHPLRAGHQVPPDDAGAGFVRFGPQTVGEFLRRCGSGVRRCAESHDEGGRARAHRLDVGGVLRDGLAADVVRGRPVEPEMPALDQHVGGDHHPAIGGVHHGGVIARAHRHAVGHAPARHQPVDERELAHLTHRGIRTLGHGTPPDTLR